MNKKEKNIENKRIHTMNRARELYGIIDSSPRDYTSMCYNKSYPNKKPNKNEQEEKNKKNRISIKKYLKQFGRKQNNYN